MSAAIPFFYWLSCFVVLGEALGRLENISPFARGLDRCQRCVLLVKAICWMLVAIGAAGAVAAPLHKVFEGSSGTLLSLAAERPTFAQTAVLMGFAILILKTRFKVLRNDKQSEN